MIFSAVEGVEAQSETVWRQATKYSVPRLCFINKMDRIGAEFDRVFEEIDERLLESHPIPVQIPIGAGPEGTMGEFQGLIDLIAMKALYYKTEDLGSTITEAEIPDDLRPEAELWRETMLDALSDFDEPFAEQYMAHLEGGELTEEMIHAGAPPGHPDRPGAAGAVRVELQVRRRPAAARRGGRLPARARSTGRRSSATTPRRGPRSPASPTPTGPSAAWSSRSPTTPTATCRSSAIYSGTLKAGTRVYNPGRDKKENLLAALPHPRRRPREDRRGAGRRHRRRRRA